MNAPLPLVSVGPSPARRSILIRRVRLFVTATITYNVVEAIVAVSAGRMASSTALIGFGLDSIIEVASATSVAWQSSGPDHERRERTALRIIALSFFALAAYVSVESVRALVGADRAEHSTIGLVLAAVSLAVMPVLSAAQRRAGRELGSASAVADSNQTLLCTYLSAVLLVGLAINSLFGWWWADPAAALVIAAIPVKESREAGAATRAAPPTPSCAPPPQAATPAGATANAVTPITVERKLRAREVPSARDTSRPASLGATDGLEEGDPVFPEAVQDRDEDDRVPAAQDEAVVGASSGGDPPHRPGKRTRMLVQGAQGHVVKDRDGEAQTTMQYGHRAPMT